MRVYPIADRLESDFRYSLKIEGRPKDRGATLKHNAQVVLLRAYLDQDRADSRINRFKLALVNLDPDQFKPRIVDQQHVVVSDPEQQKPN